MLPLSGFEHVNRYIDRRDGVPTAKLRPGEYYVSRGVERLVTVAGSALAVAVHDKRCEAFGLSVFSLPAASEGGEDYGRHALDLLVGGLIRQGASRSSMRASLVGAGRMAWDSQSGSENLQFAREQLERHGIEVARQITGFTQPHKLWLHPKTRSMTVEAIRPVNDTVSWRELTYMDTLTRVWAGRLLRTAEDMLTAHEALIRRLDFLMSCTCRLRAPHSPGAWTILREALGELADFLDDHFDAEESEPVEAWVTSKSAQNALLTLQSHHKGIRLRTARLRDELAESQVGTEEAVERVADLVGSLRAHERAEHRVVSEDHLRRRRLLH